MYLYNRSFQAEVCLPPFADLNLRGAFNMIVKIILAF